MISSGLPGINLFSAESQEGNQKGLGDCLDSSNTEAVPSPLRQRKAVELLEDYVQLLRGILFVFFLNRQGTALHH